MENSEQEKLLKDKIFSAFTDYHSASSPDLIEKFYKLFSELVFKWCIDFRFRKNALQMGLEIAGISSRVIKKNKFLNNKDEFFAYLFEALANGELEYYRCKNKGLITIPDKKLAQLNTIKKIIGDDELSTDEEDEIIAEYFPKHEFRDLTNMLNVTPFSRLPKTVDSEIDIQDKIISTLYLDPQEEFSLKLETETKQKIIFDEAKVKREAITSVLETYQKRSRGYILALYTLYCFKEKQDLEGIYPVLDQQILEICQTGTKIPRMYEIYKNFHPKTSQKSSEARSSEVLTKFLGEIKTFIEGKKILNSPP